MTRTPGNPQALNGFQAAIGISHGGTCYATDALIRDLADRAELAIGLDFVARPADAVAPPSEKVSRWNRSR